MSPSSLPLPPLRHPRPPLRDRRCPPPALLRPGRGRRRTSRQDTPPSPAEILLASEDWVEPPAEISEAVLAPNVILNVYAQSSQSGRALVPARGQRRTDHHGPLRASLRRAGRPVPGAAVEPAAARISIRNSAGLQVISAADGSVVDIEVPDDARASPGRRWSPDGSLRGLLRRTPTTPRTSTWPIPKAASRAGSRADPVLGDHGLAPSSGPPNGEEIATVLVPEDRPAPPRPRRPCRDRSPRQADRGRTQHPAHVREPHGHPARRGAAGVARHRPARHHRRREPARHRPSASPP